MNVPARSKPENSICAPSRCGALHTFFQSETHPIPQSMALGTSFPHTKDTRQISSPPITLDLNTLPHPLDPEPSIQSP